MSEQKQQPSDPNDEYTGIRDEDIREWLDQQRAPQPKKGSQPFGKRER